MNTNKIKIKSRFYINSQPLLEGESISISDNIFHHLFSVLRCKAEDYISLFNETDGEFLSIIKSINKKEAQIEILSLTKKPIHKDFNIHLAYAPLKKDANDYALEKSCELGVNEITQIITNNTVNKPSDTSKLTQKLISATQQCERLDIPKLHSSTSLLKFLDKYSLDINKKIFWFYERGAEYTFSQYLRNNYKQDFKDIIILIGPEGGFSETEINLLKSLDYVTQVHLNTNILRAETACITALINFQIISCNL